MIKPMIAALMMTLALTACHKSDNNPPAASGSSSSSAAPAGGAAPSGLSGLGGSTKK
jgi:hypothetical protein